jgi:hypothetical protein
MPVCQGSPIGRGGRPKPDMLWVRIPPLVPKGEKNEM